MKTKENNMREEFISTGRSRKEVKTEKRSEIAREYRVKMIIVITILSFITLSSLVYGKIMSMERDEVIERILNNPDISIKVKNQFK